MKNEIGEIRMIFFKGWFSEEVKMCFVYYFLVKTWKEIIIKKEALLLTQASTYPFTIQNKQKTSENKDD